MSTLEIVIFVCVGVFALTGVLLIMASIKKKKKKVEEEPKAEPKIEPAIKSDRKPVEKKEEEPVKVTMPEQFQIIRRKSKVKINKKAIKGDSRNPSITKVFVDGKRVDEPPKEQTAPAKPKTTIADIIKKQQSSARYGAREPEFKDLSKAEITAPNRSPIIGDRTNFASHLNVTSDNNLSGVAGTGVAKALAESESRGKDIDKRTQDLVQSIKQNMLSQQDSSNSLLIGINPPFSNNNADLKPASKLKNIDAKTLIIAEAINNPKSKRG